MMENNDDEGIDGEGEIKKVQVLFPVSDTGTNGVPFFFTILFWEGKSCRGSESVCPSYTMLTRLIIPCSHRT